MKYSAPQISHLPAQPGFEHLYPIHVWHCAEDESVEIGRDTIIGWQISVEVSEHQDRNGDHKTLTTVSPMTVEGALRGLPLMAVKKPDGSIYSADEDATFPDERALLERWKEQIAAQNKAAA